MRPEREPKAGVFISFAHEDKAWTAIIEQSLSKIGVPVWIDYGKITPGTPDWEEAIRRGLDSSLAVVLLATPRSRQSKYVKAELALARMKGLTVYPLWIDGDQWPDCVALEMIHAQYIDARDKKVTNGLAQLCAQIKELSNKLLPSHIFIEDALKVAEEDRDYFIESEVTPPPGYISVLLVETSKIHKGCIIPAAFFRLSAFDVIGQLLDDLFTIHLHKKYSPRTYGSEWLLLRSNWLFLADDTRLPFKVLAPWAWLSENGNTKTSFREWQKTRSLFDCNVRSGSVWSIGMVKPNEFVGIAARDPQFLNAITNSRKAAICALDEGLLDSAELQMPTEKGLIQEIVVREAVCADYWPPDRRAVAQVQGREQEKEEFIRYWGRL
jgi:hypothetical protein